MTPKPGAPAHPAKHNAPARPNLLAGEGLPPRPRQQRSADKRERLKASALALFREHGYEGASVGQIARRAKLAVGGSYRHFRSKRQLLLVLMDDLLVYLSRLDFRPGTATQPRTLLRELLARAFSGDLRYLGAYRAWQEAVLSDPDLAHKQREIHAWTNALLLTVFKRLQQLPGARPGVDLPALARVMDGFFWSLMAQAVRAPRAELNEWLDSATHLVYHALFTDPPKKARTK
jgi:AcrR family transcriptional regulator